MRLLSEVLDGLLWNLEADAEVGTDALAGVGAERKTRVAAIDGASSRVTGIHGEEIVGNPISAGRNRAELRIVATGVRRHAHSDARVRPVLVIVR